MRRIITAMFHSEVTARRAAERLRALGVLPDRIELHSQSGEDVVPATGGSPGSEHGLLQLLDAMFLPRADFALHLEALRRGGIVLTVDADESVGEKIRAILKESGAEDLDAHEQDWRRQGWHPPAKPAPAPEAKVARREDVPGPARSYAVPVPRDDIH